MPLLLLTAFTIMANPQGPIPTPPPTRKGDLVEEKFGVKVADPYRWLEDADSDETKAWVKAQNEVTFGYLRAVPEWKPIRSRLEELITFERFGDHRLVGNHLCYTRNSGTQNQSVIYVSDLDGKNPRILLDPNTLSTDGTVAVGAYSFSPDGKYMAYSISVGGSDWQEWRVREVETGKDLPDVVKWSKFSDASWRADSKGFFYAAYDAPKEGEAALSATNYYQKVYFHTLGTDATKDPLIYQNPDQKEWGFGATATEDGKYLVISQSEGTRSENRVYIGSPDGSSAVNPLFDKFDATYTYLTNEGSRFYFLTDKDASRRKVIAVDLAKPDEWTTVVPEVAETLDSASVVGNTLYTSYLKDAHSVVRQFDLTGKAKGEVKLPGLGTVSGLGGHRKDPITFFAFSSFTTPGAIYRLDTATSKVSRFRTPKLTFNPDQFVTEQVFYTSKDGTRVPMFISYKKGLKRDGSNPTLLYGYGGFSIALTPSFSTRMLKWMEMGGVYVMANIRGGSEYGKDWYDNGKLEKKQNVFDDFIAGAEYLIKEKWTSTPKLAIEGGSNGGLLVGACMTQRPDLFGAAIPQVGVLDMLRYDQFTIGYAWKSDYLDPQTEAGFKGLLKFSPLHNLKPGTKYPATLIVTGDHDDRVVPAHSYKFAAALQAAQGGTAPTLIRIETSAGHGAGMPLSKSLDLSADLLAFLVKNLGVKAR